MGEFSKDKLYQLYFRGSSLKLFLQGVNKYKLYLDSIKGEGTKIIDEKLDQINRLIVWLEKKMAEVESDWDLEILPLYGETLCILKSTLPYILKDLELERIQILKKNSPPEATEGVDTKIENVKTLMETGTMAKVPTGNIMGKIEKNRKLSNIASTRTIILMDQELKRTVREITNDSFNNDRALDDAATILEDRIRNVAGLQKSDIGQRLIDKALNPSNGVLVISEVANEQEGYWKLYDGFLKAIKNPTSHRRIKITKKEVMQIIEFADFLIGLLQRSRQRKPI